MIQTFWLQEAKRCCGNSKCAICEARLHLPSYKDTPFITLAQTGNGECLSSTSTVGTRCMDYPDWPMSLISWTRLLLSHISQLQTKKLIYVPQYSQFRWLNSVSLYVFELILMENLTRKVTLSNVCLNWSLERQPLIPEEFEMPQEHWDSSSVL